MTIKFVPRNLRLPALQRFLHADFARNMAIVMSGATLAQGINVLLSPVLSRLYSPSEFGVFGLYSSVAMTLAVPSALCYEHAIVIPEDDEEAANLTVLGLIVVVAVSLLLYALLLLGYLGLPALLSEGHGRWMWFIPAAVLARGGWMVLVHWAMRRSAFKQVSLSRVSQPLVMACVQVTLGLMGLTALGLVIGQLAGLIASFVVLGFVILRTDLPLFLERLSGVRVRVLARKHGNFPRYSAPQVFISSLAQYVPVLAFAHFFDAAFVGFYTLVARVLQLPLSLVGQSVREVFFPQLAVAHRSGEAYGALTRVTLLLAVIGGLPALALLPVAPQLFGLVFGEQWRIAGFYAQILTPWMLTSFITVPVTAAVPILGLQRWNLLLGTIQSALGAITVVVGGWLQSPVLALALLSAAGVVTNLFLALHVFRVARFELSRARAN